MTPAERDLLVAIAECLFVASDSARRNVTEWRAALDQVKREQSAADPVGHTIKVSREETDWR